MSQSGFTNTPSQEELTYIDRRGEILSKGKRLSMVEKFYTKQSLGETV